MPSGLFDNTPAQGENFLTAIGMMDPGFRQEIFAQRAAQGLYKSYLASGFKPEEAAQLVMNPEAGRAYGEAHFGNPKAEGALKVGDVSSPVLVHDRGVYGIPGISGGAGGGPGVGIQDLLKLSNQQAADKAAAVKQATLQAENLTNLPNALATSQAALENIDTLSADPGLKDVTGWVGGRTPDWALSPKQTDTAARIEQLKGQAMAVSVHASKGDFGRIALAEANALQKGAARLSRASSYEGFMTSLKDYRKLVSGIHERAGVMAGVGPTPAQAAPQSKVPGPAAPPTFSEGATAINPKTGQRIMLRGGQWQPAQ